jgi:threonyl-tRNA synthetase
MSSEITVTLPDGTPKQLPAGATGADLAAAIGPRLAKAALAVTVDGAPTDLGVPLPDGAQVGVITIDSDAGRYVLRHSTAHVLAQAVTDLWPGAKYAIGPPIEYGFYYDFELPDGASFTDDDLERIEKRMREIIAESQPFVREVHSIDEGLELFADQPYKVEIIKGVDATSEGEGAGAGIVTAYRNTAGFVDLCRGPHVPTTARLGSFKLQRVYGTAWESDKALAAHLTFLEEAEKRDHRKLGAELDLFSLPPQLGGGLVLWHPKGARVRRIIEDFSRNEHDAGGYELAFTPHLAKSVLWETSGHLDF